MMTNSRIGMVPIRVAYAMAFSRLSRVMRVILYSLASAAFVSPFAMRVRIVAMSSVDMRRALELDPLSFQMNRHLGSTLYIARHYDEALYYLRRASEMEPNRPEVVENWISAIYEKEGRQDDAVTHELVAMGGDHPQIEVERLRSIYHDAGWKAYWQARIDMMAPDADRYPWVPCVLGVSYLRLGDRDRAFSWFNRAVDQRCYCMIWLKVDPLMDDIRTDKRYHELLRRVNLSE
jgi:Tfp pilus assembly protein PilF